MTHGNVPEKRLKTSTWLAWGLVGSLHRVEALTVVPGQSGVVRLIPNTIQYSKPPLELTWYPVKTEPGRYEMSWPEDPTAVRTLGNIAAEARQYSFSQPLTESHPIAQELDQAVFSLLRQAEKLHRAGWGVGLLTPANVMLLPGPNGPEAVLVDLGFTWKGDFGDPPWDASPGKPNWLATDDVENPASAVWDRPPVEQQFAQPTGHPFGPAAPGSETRTLARVIAWALTGRPSRDLIPGQLPPVWEVLEAAVAGEISSIKNLLTALQDAPPSSHFYAPPKPIELLPSQPAKKPFPMLLLGGVIGLAILAGIAALLLLPGQATPTSGSPATGSPATNETTPPTAIQPTALNAMKLYQDAKDLLDRVKKFADVARQGQADPSLSPQIAAAREKLFGDWVTECEQEVNLSAEAAQRAQAGEKLRQLVNQYEKLHSDHPPSSPAMREKERQWLDQYNREAELLGWPR